MKGGAGVLYDHSDSLFLNLDDLGRIVCGILEHWRKKSNVCSTKIVRCPAIEPKLFSP